MNHYNLFVTIVSYHKKFKIINEKTVTVTECNDIELCTKHEMLLLQDVVLVSMCMSNLILFEQLQCNDIIYQNDDSKMKLIKDEHIVVSAQ